MLALFLGIQLTEPVQQYIWHLVYWIFSQQLLQCHAQTMPRAYTTPPLLEKMDRMFSVGGRIVKTFVVSEMTDLLKNYLSMLGCVFNFIKISV